MDNNLSALTYEEIATTRAVIRVFRYLTVVATAAAVPLVLMLATPLFGWALLTAVVSSPLILCYVVFAAAHQAEAERRAAR